MSKQAKCRSCQAPIIWAETAHGKKIPLDAEPDQGKGNITLSDTGRAEVLGGDALTRACDAEVVLYVSHFATCPQAGQHRKRTQQ